MPLVRTSNGYFHRDQFSRTDPGGVVPGPGYTAVSGTWLGIAGVVAAGVRDNSLSLTPASPTGSILLFDTALSGPITVQAMMKRKGVALPRPWVIIRYVDANNYMYVGLSESGATRLIALFKVVAGVVSQIGTSYTFNYGDNSLIGVEAYITDNLQQVRLFGVVGAGPVIISGTDASFNGASGKVGFRVSGTGATQAEMPEWVELVVTKGKTLSFTGLPTGWKVGWSPIPADQVTEVAGAATITIPNWPMPLGGIGVYDQHNEVRENYVGGSAHLNTFLAADNGLWGGDVYGWSNVGEEKLTRTAVGATPGSILTHNVPEGRSVQLLNASRVVVATGSAPVGGGDVTLTGYTLGAGFTIRVAGFGYDYAVFGPPVDGAITDGDTFNFEIQTGTIYAGTDTLVKTRRGLIYSVDFSDVPDGDVPLPFVVIPEDANGVDAFISSGRLVMTNDVRVFLPPGPYIPFDLLPNQGSVIEVDVHRGHPDGIFRLGNGGDGELYADKTTRVPGLYELEVKGAFSILADNPAGISGGWGIEVPSESYSMVGSNGFDQSLTAKVDVKTGRVAYLFWGFERTHVDGKAAQGTWEVTGTYPMLNARGTALSAGYGYILGEKVLSFVSRLAWSRGNNVKFTGLPSGALVKVGTIWTEAAVDGTALVDLGMSPNPQPSAKILFGDGSVYFHNEALHGGDEYGLSTVLAPIPLTQETPTTPNVPPNTGSEPGDPPPAGFPTHEDPVTVFPGGPVGGSSSTITDMRVIVNEGHYAARRLVSITDWIPYAESYVIPPSDYAAGWRNLVTFQYRHTSGYVSNPTEPAEFFPRWARPSPIPQPARATLAQMDVEGVVLEGTSITKRPDAVSLDYLTCFTIGPIGFSDTSQELTARIWRARYDVLSGNVMLARENNTHNGWDAETILFNPGVEIEELDMCFDQNARPFSVSQRTVAGNKEVWIYWYDPVAADFVYEKLADGRNPRMVLDYLAVSADFSDVLIFYVNDLADHVCFRVQRELYAIEHETPIQKVANYYLEDLALTTDHRLQVLGSVHDPVAGTWDVAILESAPYPLSIVEGHTNVARAQAWTLVDVLIVQEHPAYISQNARVPVFLLSDLTMRIDPEGTFAGKTDIESTQLSARGQSFLISSAILVAETVGENIQLIGRAQTFDQTEYVIVAQTVDDVSTQVSARAQTFLFT